MTLKYISEQSHFAFRSRDNVHTPSASDCKVGILNYSTYGSLSPGNSLYQESKYAYLYETSIPGYLSLWTKTHLPRHSCKLQTLALLADRKRLRQTDMTAVRKGGGESLNAPLKLAEVLKLLFFQLFTVTHSTGQNNTAEFEALLLDHWNRLWPQLASRGIKIEATKWQFEKTPNKSSPGTWNFTCTFCKVQQTKLSTKNKRLDLYKQI